MLKVIVANILRKAILDLQDLWVAVRVIQTLTARMETITCKR
jgi:hypothetical protein